jgi:hypothetical protein
VTDQVKEARKRARKRSAKVRKSEKLKHYDYIEELGRFGISKIKCKCGQTLQELRPVPGMQETERIKGATIIRERVAMFTNAAYTEVVITFTDGSKHVTPICVDCVRRGLSIEQLDDIYAADMERWDEEESRGLGKVRWDMNADRVVASYKVVPAEERFRD